MIVRGPEPGRRYTVVSDGRATGLLRLRDCGVSLLGLARGLLLGRFRPGPGRLGRRHRYGWDSSRFFVTEKGIPESPLHRLEDDVHFNLANAVQSAHRSGEEVVQRVGVAEDRLAGEIAVAGRG